MAPGQIKVKWVYVLNVEKNIVEVRQGPALPATLSSIDQQKGVVKMSSKPAPNGQGDILKPDPPSSDATEKRQVTIPHQTSENSAEPTTPSKPRWQRPRTVGELAAQANAVATQVLNGEIDLERARVYATFTRVIAQSVSLEVTRARFLKQVPVLELPAPKEEE